MTIPMKAEVSGRNKSQSCYRAVAEDDAIQMSQEYPSYEWYPLIDTSFKSSFNCECQVAAVNVKGPIDCSLCSQDQFTWGSGWIGVSQQVENSEAPAALFPCSPAEDVINLHDTSLSSLDSIFCYQTEGEPKFSDTFKLRLLDVDRNVIGHLRDSPPGTGGTPPNPCPRQYKYYSCPYPHCSSDKQKRSDNLREHIRRVHGYVIPKGLTVRDWLGKWGKICVEVDYQQEAGR
ncbi:hypothetical protein BDZ91DRAFT_347953 [Kalaharituber pfeilii]|nr:hypothetical protein BDZ91DRAFT_347953 [Kalaharituber pfeilii]